MYETSIFQTFPLVQYKFAKESLQYGPTNSEYVFVYLNLSRSKH